MTLEEVATYINSTRDLKARNQYLVPRAEEIAKLMRQSPDLTHEAIPRVTFAKVATWFREKYNVYLDRNEAGLITDHINKKAESAHTIRGRHRKNHSVAGGTSIKKMQGAGNPSKHI